jgi:arabinogalactan endo-1,4-beta-galactosidase
MDNGGGRWTESRFYTDITTRKVIFKVNMAGKDVSKGVYITGDFTAKSGNWKIIPMTNEGNGIFSYSTFLKSGTTGAFYYLNSNDWSFRETVPSVCAKANGTDRQYTIPDGDITYLYSFGACSSQETLPVKVTFKVDMTGQNQSRGVFITGDVTEWAIVKMTSEGNNIYSYSKTLIPGATLAYYYLTTSTWTDYLNYREKVPAECALVWNSDRRIIVPNVETQIGVKWASCEKFLNVSSDLIQMGSINLYPNPASGQVNINAGFNLENSTLSISNIQGQMIKRVKLRSAGNEIVHVSDIPPGLYIFIVQQSNWLETFKVVLL